MGGPMCRNIIKGGHEVRIYDLSEAAIKDCEAVGGIAANSIAETVADAAIVMTSLPMPADVETVAIGPDGILFTHSTIILTLSFISSILHKYLS